MNTILPPNAPPFWLNMPVTIHIAQPETEIEKAIHGFPGVLMRFDLGQDNVYHALVHVGNRFHTLKADDFVCMPHSSRPIEPQPTPQPETTSNETDESTPTA